MYSLFGLDQLETIQCSVLAMGRFAGDEMNYGSDLDLIFIEKVMVKNSDEYIVNKVRKMLRYIATMDPSGALYEIDMRLKAPWKLRGIDNTVREFLAISPI